MRGAEGKLRLRPYRRSDSERIVTWCTSEQAHYLWSAGVLGDYPLSPERLDEALSEMEARGPFLPFAAVMDGEPVGFFTLRQPGEDSDELRFGFVILSPALRGKGLGKKMLSLGLAYVYEVYQARRVTLGVFAQNTAALRCYEAAGFTSTGVLENYDIMGETWKCVEMAAERRD